MSKRTLVVFLFALSGACDLVCEIAWSRTLGLVFGVTVFALSAVLAIFMLGMAAGGFVAGRLLRWRGDPQAVFAQVHVALCAATIGTWPLFSAIHVFYVGANHDLPAWALQPSVLLLSTLVLIVPTTLMGTTLPVASALLQRSTPGDDAVGRDIGGLYAAGTFGGVLGAAGAAFVLLPAAGTFGTVGIAALADAFIALAAFAAVPGGGRRAAKEA